MLTRAYGLFRWYLVSPFPAYALVRSHRFDGVVADFHTPCERYDCVACVVEHGIPFSAADVDGVRLDVEYLEDILIGFAHLVGDEADYSDGAGDRFFAGDGYNQLAVGLYEDVVEAGLIVELWIVHGDESAFAAEPWLNGGEEVEVKSPASNVVGCDGAELAGEGLSHVGESVVEHQCLWINADGFCCTLVKGRVCVVSPGIKVGGNEGVIELVDGGDQFTPTRSLLVRHAWRRWGFGSGLQLRW